MHNWEKREHVAGEFDNLPKPALFMRNALRLVSRAAEADSDATAPAGATQRNAVVEDGNNSDGQAPQVMSDSDSELDGDSAVKRPQLESHARLRMRAGPQMGTSVAGSATTTPPSTSQRAAMAFAATMARALVAA
mmetsp:Transcript_21594/g.45585  ORF Transcript_21594/g.45585 Transcript_21594/m.45585 type:complete len:135 (-) Transcript_21594:592-996(-)|eukprot:6172512-Pleurochrysis_carterae.AAC.5